MYIPTTNINIKRNRNKIAIHHKKCKVNVDTMGYFFIL